MAPRNGMAVGLFIAIILSGCSVGQRVDADRVNAQLPSARSIEPATEDAVEESGFVLQSDTEVAEREIAAAKLIFDTSIQAVAAFSKQTSRNCDSAEMERAVTALQEIERKANRYVDMAVERSSERDREAALDVADEMTPLALDGYMEATAAYRSQHCYQRAKFYLQEIIRIYLGDSFVQWRKAAIKQLEEIAAAEQEDAKVKKATTKKKTKR